MTVTQFHASIANDATVWIASIKKNNERRTIKWNRIVYLPK